jgi:VanZ like family/Concanavalin A-like lectin/glucanases superfamily
MQKTALGILCAFVLIGILIAGLWPFHAPKNDVSWLSNGDGIRFGRYGLIFDSAESNSPMRKDGTSGSVEIWLQPALDTGGTILAFYTPENRISTFSLHQSLDDLLLRRVTVYRQHRVRTKWYVGQVLRKNMQVIVTITAGLRGTTVYVNGALAGSSARFGLSSEDLTGQLVVGNNPLVDDGWQGQLRGLAIYHRELTAAEVSQHYDAWTTNRKTAIKNEGAAALYLCNERTGSVVHNQMNSGHDLQIPERYIVLHAPFLELPWDEFQPSWGYCKDVLINIGGFIPLGLFFCAYFSSVRRLGRAALATIVLGAAVSLTIEVLQAFLPTRDSGMTDIVTNTLGTGVGAMLYGREWVQAIVVRIGLGGWMQRVTRA